MRANRIVALLAALCLALTAAGCAQPAPAPTPAPTETVQTATPAPTPEPTLPPPPELDIRSWEFLYAGPTQGVSRYHPRVRNIEGQYMDERCADATLDFLNAARAEGYTVYICSAYRNFEYTMFWYEKEMRKYGSSYEAAQHGFAPGCSEHSTGLAFDITDEMDLWGNYFNMHDETVTDTEVYRWMCDHCAEYGFIVRYPEGKEEVYGMACYPGHFRYVGPEAARYITENGLCLEEFLALYQ